MNEEIILDKLRKMLFTTQQANECGLSNNDFKEDIQILSGAIGLIENLIQRNKNLEQIEKEHKEENGKLREENEVLRYGLRENKILRHGLEENTEEIDKLYKIINLMAIDLEYINKEILDEYDKLPYAESKQKVIDYFTNKVEESNK